LLPARQVTCSACLSSVLKIPMPAQSHQHKKVTHTTQHTVSKHISPRLNRATINARTGLAGCKPALPQPTCFADLAHQEPGVVHATLFKFQHIMLVMLMLVLASCNFTWPWCHCCCGVAGLNKDSSRRCG
jgi:hypothetical protein